MTRKNTLWASLVILTVGATVFSSALVYTPKPRETARRQATSSDQRPPRADYRKAIERVLHEDAIALIGKKSDRDYARKIRAIEIGDCPEDFRLAWVDFIHAADTLAGARGIDSAAVFTWKLTVSTLAVSGRGVSEAFSSVGEPLMRFNRTWQAVEKCAVKHGAKINIGNP